MIPSRFEGRCRTISRFRFPLKILNFHWVFLHVKTGTTDICERRALCRHSELCLTLRRNSSVQPVVSSMQNGVRRRTTCSVDRSEVSGFAPRNKRCFSNEHSNVRACPVLPWTRTSILENRFQNFHTNKIVV